MKTNSQRNIRVKGTIRTSGNKKPEKKGFEQASAEATAIGCSTIVLILVIAAVIIGLMIA